MTGGKMFFLVLVGLNFLALLKFIRYHPITSKYRWLFRIFFVIFSLYALGSLVSPTFWSPFQKSIILLISVIPLIPYYLFNKNKIYVLVFAVGIISNHLTVVLNRGFMPVSKDAVIKSWGKLLPVKDDGEIMVNQPFKYKYIDDKTVLPFLGDTIYIPHIGGVSSIGDWLVYLNIPIFLFTRIESDDELKHQKMKKNNSG